MYTKLNYKQKLQALADKYYSNLKWEPKAGDYYTTCRNDLELYQITSEDDVNFYTVYCSDPKKKESAWRKERFLLDFGVNRVLVSNYILEHEIFKTEA